MQDLQSTDPAVVDHADCTRTGPSRQREVDRYYKIGNGSALKDLDNEVGVDHTDHTCLLYTSPSPRDGLLSRMPSSA